MKMADNGGARSVQKGLVTTAGLANASGKSGADLHHAALLAKAGTTAGPGKDGALLELLANGG